MTDRTIKRVSKEPTHAQIKTLLVRARDLLSNRSRWVKGRGQRPATGKAPFGYCMVGAIAREGGQYVNDIPDYVEESNTRLVTQAMNALSKQLPPTAGMVIPYYNDAASTTHADVLGVFDRAIAAEAELVKQEVKS